MEKLKTIHIAWLFPLILLIHQVEELYASVGFPKWYSEFFHVNLIIDLFLMINAIGLALMIAFALIYSLGGGSSLILLAFGTLVFVNGFLHVGASIFTSSYSPGTISGLFLFIPLGIVTFKKILPLLSRGEKFMGISLGILIHIIAIYAAMRM